MTSPCVAIAGREPRDRALSRNTLSALITRHPGICKGWGYGP